MNAPTAESHVAAIAVELGVRQQQVHATVALLDDGATMPFIARYRKEATGSLDEVAVMTVRDRIAQLREMDERLDAMLSSLEERGLLTDELRDRLAAAPTLTEMEDVYLPYRPKRRTRAMVARERGLEPLAEVLWAQEPSVDPTAAAAAYVDPENGVEDEAAALAGARDIVAEWVSEDEWARSTTRQWFTDHGLLRSQVAKGKEEEGAKFRDYFDAEELAWKAPSHRLLAIFRGEQEGALSVQVRPEEGKVVAGLGQHFVAGTGAASGQVEQALEDGYKRLLGPSMETEARKSLKERADATAIGVFAENLRKLLLAPPLGQKTTLAIDPGFRTGCKVVCLDRQGALVHSDTVYLHMGAEREAKEAQKLVEMMAAMRSRRSPSATGPRGARPRPLSAS